MIGVFKGLLKKTVYHIYFNVFKSFVKEAIVKVPDFNIRAGNPDMFLGMNKCYNINMATSKNKIIIIYATNSGSTYLAGKIVQATLAAENSVVLKKASDTKPAELDQYDIVILGSPNWNFGDKEGMPHETMLQFMIESHGMAFPDKKFAVFSCGDSSYAYFCGAVEHLEKFVSGLQGILIVDSLKIDGYYFDLEKNSRLAEQWAGKLKSKLK